MKPFRVGCAGKARAAEPLFCVCMDKVLYGMYCDVLARIGLYPHQESNHVQDTRGAGRGGQGSNNVLCSVPMLPATALRHDDSRNATWPPRYHPPLQYYSTVHPMPGNARTRMLRTTAVQHDPNLSTTIATIHLLTHSHSLSHALSIFRHDDDPLSPPETTDIDARKGYHRPRGDSTCRPPVAPLTPRYIKRSAAGSILGSTQGRSCSAI
jgi:hypothetical protein